MTVTVPRSHCCQATLPRRQRRSPPGSSRWLRLSRKPDAAGLLSAFEGALSSRDRELLNDQRYVTAFAATLRQGPSQGTGGGGWDNVSWIGEWDIDLSAVRCPVLMWYGTGRAVARDKPVATSMVIPRQWPTWRKSRSSLPTTSARPCASATCS
jgi:hypothetical protein